MTDITKIPTFNVTDEESYSKALDRMTVLLNDAPNTTENQYEFYHLSVQCDRWEKRHLSS